jgi:hypothetical protein
MAALPSSPASRNALALIAILLAVQAAVLHLMGRVWVCTCGTVHFWVGDIHSSELSQQFTDWYTFSHIVHGIIFYAVLHRACPRLSALSRLALATGLESSWEMAENTPWVIEAYRQQALAAGYTGDSVLNSLSDTLSMVTGFTLARFLPWRLTLALALGLEIGAAWMVHDNFTLNLLNFMHRFRFIEAWQTRV